MRVLTILAVTPLLSASCLPTPEPGADTETPSTEGSSTSTTSSATDPTTADETGAPGCDDPPSAVAQIFADGCAAMGCHGTEAAAGLDLVSDGWPQRLIGQASTLCEGWIRVVPGDAEASLLFDKLSAPASCGAPMPIGEQLPVEQIDCIGAWIAQLDPVDCETCGGEACIDTTSDPMHCGGCDMPCPSGVSCDAGTCACPEGTMQCVDACVDPLADGAHCGGCEQPCEGGLLCLAGACVAGCGALTECNGGCVDTDTSPMHCGGCDAPCPAGGSCEGGICGCPGPAVSYAADIEPLMVNDCTSMGCHGFPMPQDGLDLREGMGYDDLFDVTSAQCGDRLLVAPGQPDDSYLLDKLLGVDLCMGTSMPKAAPAYSAMDIELITAWICQGAPP